MDDAPPQENTVRVRPEVMDNRTVGTFLTSLAALIVALATFLSQPAAPQLAPAASTTTGGATSAPTTTAPPEALTTATNAALSPIQAAADAYATVSKAQTDRYKAVSDRLKDQATAHQQGVAAICKWIYDFLLLLFGFVILLELLPRVTNLSAFGILVALSPAPAPSEPKNQKLKNAQAADAPRIHLSHDFVGSSWPRRPRFVVRLDGSDLDTVASVKYYLHPAYAHTIHVLTEPPFKLEFKAIGEFLLYADVTLKDGSIVRLEQYLHA